MMHHQYWVTKKTILKKLGTKEDECIVSSDAELDAKLELFKSISENCANLQKVLEAYQEKICNLAKEENALGRYLKDVAKHEKNKSASELIMIAGKAVSYISHQRLPIRSSLARLHQEAETFQARAVSDTRATASEMEKARMEYRAALTWMKSASSELDPDSCQSLEKFRKAQSQVKICKAKFDKLKLACLEKVDLLAAARCNMFSHTLVPYQNSNKVYVERVAEMLLQAVEKLGNHNTNNASKNNIEIASKTDKDQKLFFDEYKDKIEGDQTEELPKPDEFSGLLCDFESNLGPLKLPQSESNENNLLDLNWPTTSTSTDLLGNTFGQFLPLIPESKEGTLKSVHNSKSEEKSKDIPSWLNLFKDLDPLENMDFVTKTESKDCA